jgi:hypothetical protein
MIRGPKTKNMGKGIKKAMAIQDGKMIPNCNWKYSSGVEKAAKARRHLNTEKIKYYRMARAAGTGQTIKEGFDYLPN